MTVHHEIPEWYSPDVTIWKSPDSDVTKAAYRAHVASGAAYLIREVVARGPGFEGNSADDPSAYPKEILLHLAEQAEHEFSLLRMCGVQAPEVDWCTPDHNGRTRLVARVPVVEGTEIPSTPKDDSYNDHLFRLGLYQLFKAPGARLMDVSIDQCLNGHVRGQPGADSLHFIDIEPIFR